MTSGVHGIAALRAARQRITGAGGPDLSIKTLGSARIKSPLAALLDAWQTTEHYVDEDDRVLLDDTLSMVRARGGSISDLPSFEPSGPRRKIFFDPSKTRAGIVTCGGLCPGLNDVIRGLVRNLTNHYGVRRVIASVISEREARIAVVGVPKTIDNDIPYLDQSFGFQTAFARATESIHAVTVEAKATVHGVGLVKLMGRHSGFIACYAALARNDAGRGAHPGGPVPARRG